MVSETVRKYTCFQCLMYFRKYTHLHRFFIAENILFNMWLSVSVHVLLARERKNYSVKSWIFLKVRVIVSNFYFRFDNNNDFR